jgi:hypothetical protein
VVVQMRRGQRHQRHKCDDRGRGQQEQLAKGDGAVVVASI